jgi:DNA-directed RNA polymerase subunit RPC12/RpoP
MKLAKKFRIQNKVLLPKRTWETKKVSKNVNDEFYCTECQEKIQFNIKPFQTGHPLSELYDEQSIIRKEELVRNNVAQKSYSWQSHLGELVINNKPALYDSISCPNCSSTYLLVFGFGESQPGRFTVEVSGVWKIKTMS